MFKLDKDKLTVSEVLKHLEQVESQLLEFEGMGEWCQELIDDYKAASELLDCMMHYWACNGTFYAQPGLVQGATATADIMGVLMYYKPIVDVKKGVVW